MENKKTKKTSTFPKKFTNFLTTHDKPVAVFCGIITGLINGLFGGGGGMVVVPMLNKLLNHSPKESHATAILIILPLSITSGLFYLAFGNLQWDLALPVTLGVMAGGVLGAFLLKKLSSKWVTLIFSIAMAVAGAKMLFF